MRQPEPSTSDVLNAETVYELIALHHVEFALHQVMHMPLNNNRYLSRVTMLTGVLIATGIINEQRLVEVINVITDGAQFIPKDNAKALSDDEILTLQESIREAAHASVAATRIASAVAATELRERDPANRIVGIITMKQASLGAVKRTAEESYLYNYLTSLTSL